MKMLYRAACMLLALLCAPAMAQDTGVTPAAPAGFMPGQAMTWTYTGTDGKLHTYWASIGTPFPVQLPTGFGGCSVVASGDQAWTIGQPYALPCTASGRLRVGLSSAAADGGTAAAYADQIAGIGSVDGKQHALRTDASGNLQTAPQAGENIIGHSLGISALASGTMTRPANTTAYVSGYMVGTSTTAGASTPITLAGAARVAGITGASPSTIGSTGTIIRLRLSKTGTSITNASFRVHLYRSLPTLTGADGGTLAGTVNGIAAVHIGYVDVTLDQSFTDGAKGEAAPASGPIIFTTAGSTSLYAVIEARAAYTPTSAETFTVTAEIAQD